MCASYSVCGFFCGLHSRIMLVIEEDKKKKQNKKINKQTNKQTKKQEQTKKKKKQETEELGWCYEAS